MSHKSQSSDRELESGDQWPPCRCDAGNRLVLKNNCGPCVNACISLKSDRLLGSMCVWRVLASGYSAYQTAPYALHFHTRLLRRRCYFGLCTSKWEAITLHYGQCRFSLSLHVLSLSLILGRTGSGSVATATNVWSGSDCLLVVISSIISIMRWRWGSRGEPELRAVAGRCWKRLGV